MKIVIVIFGALFLGMAWYFTKLSKGTYYRAVQPNEQADPLAGREARKKDLISKVKTFSLLYIVACIVATSIAWLVPKIQIVQAALNPTATPTITVTPTVTLTRTPIPTRLTDTPLPAFTPATATKTFVPTSAASAAPKVAVTQSTVIVNHNIPVTVIVNHNVPSTVIVAQTVIVPATVIVFQTVIVMVTQTFTATPTDTSTATDTETATPTPTFTPTETLTP